MIDTGIPGVEYREFELAAGGSPVAPFKASAVVVKPGYRTPRDAHAVRECWFISQGSGTLIYEDEQRVELSAGELVFFESHRPHWVENHGAEDLLLFSTWWSR